ncbi:MAG: Holliday junction branch migration protein RuvA [Candidatus Omnitrophica bacterium]|nr:Holliday junction branch migration protein RuvA [Candidatus Omnitrophota bacterium]
MIYYIQGKLVFKSPARVVLENNGVGYTLNVSLETSQSIGEEGENIRLFTFQQIREEEINLFGFSTERERETFLMLLSVPGIGPKVAMRILSGLRTDELYNAILSDDASVFTNVPGVGKKTGERLIVELKQKVEKLPVSEERQEDSEREIFASAVEALTVLGYKRREAAVSVGKIMKEKGRKMSIEEIIKEALKKG